MSIVSKTATNITKTTKASDETVNNSNVLQDDDELAGHSLTVGFHRLTVFILCNSSAVADFQWRLVFSQNVAYNAIKNKGAVAAAGSSASATQTSTFSIDGGGATDASAYLDGIVKVTTACTVKLQWAQETAEVSDTKCRAGSAIISEKL